MLMIVFFFFFFCSNYSYNNAQRVVSGKEVLVTSKVEESDVVSDLPSFEVAETNTVDRSGGMLETQNVGPEEISDDEIELPEGKSTDSQNVAPVQDHSLSDAERIQREIAATSVQAAFRGYLVIIPAVSILLGLSLSLS